MLNPEMCAFANSVNPDQTALGEAIRIGFTVFARHVGFFPLKCIIGSKTNQPIVWDMQAHWKNCLTRVKTAWTCLEDINRDEKGMIVHFSSAKTCDI